MNTPIVDFVRGYAQKSPLRFHMPGHKGTPFLGCESLDITEIPGADSLYEASGIIRQSEQNASRLFHAQTYYSAEGSSLSIRTMIALVARYSLSQNREPLIWAGRNAHSAFLSAAALMNCDVRWLYPDDPHSYLSCVISPEKLREQLIIADPKPAAVYVTAPDYLGAMVDVAGLAAACHEQNVLLLVDNAHGAYLGFLPKTQHPIALGADLCCDSAHKTLPVLTGGAYLHVSPQCELFPEREVRDAMRLFGSTSPSYLILQSLDITNVYLSEQLPKDLQTFLPQAEALKQRLKRHGYQLIGDEPLKLTLCPKGYGYRGDELAMLLEKEHIIAEFFDPDHTVLMLSPLLSESMEHLGNALCSIPQREPILTLPPAPCKAMRYMSLRQAFMEPHVILPVEQCMGRVLAQSSVSCPPAVSILVGGERIDRDAVTAFHYYGVENCCVVR